MTNALQRNWKSLLPAAIVSVAMSVQRAQGGNTTCVSNQLSWYSSVVGESPCVTYQRLRQICNGGYEVPSFSAMVPGDQCDDPVPECCCNFIAFQLSMLCMVCQQDRDDSNASAGIDAGTNTYTVYRGTCGSGPGIDRMLPSDLQSAICSENIRIDDFLYDSWDTGDWFYKWIKDNAQRLHAKSNNTFTHCSNQISTSPNTTSSTIPQTTVSLTSHLPSSGTVSSISKPKLIGGIVGGILGLAIITVAVVLWQRKKVGGTVPPETHNNPLGYKDVEEAPYVSLQAYSLVPNRLGQVIQEDGEGLTPLHMNDSDPSMPFPRTPGTRSNAVGLAETQHPVPLTEATLRHHDGGPFVMWEIHSTSGSGRLPPAYDECWAGNRGSPTHPGGETTNSVPGPMSNNPGLRIAVGQSMCSAIPLSTSRPGKGPRPPDRKHRSLFN